MSFRDSTRIKKFRREHLCNPTETEKKLNRLLVKSGIKFRNQVVIGFFIADFLVWPKTLIVEIDGSSHIGKEAYDARRELLLREWGFNILRLTNNQVSSDINGCLDKILNYSGKCGLGRTKNAVSKAQKHPGVQKHRERIT